MTLSYRRQSSDVQGKSASPIRTFIIASERYANEYNVYKPLKFLTVLDKLLIFLKISTKFTYTPLMISSVTIGYVVPRGTVSFTPMNPEMI